MNPEFSPSTDHPRRWRLRGLMSDSGGAAALEFALVGSTFLTLVCVMIELGLILFTQSLLDNGVRDGARLIRTNQASSSTIFVAKVCGDVGSLIPSCTTNLQYYVASAAAFSSLKAKTSTLPKTYTAGKTGSDMIAQVAYKRTSLISWASKYLGASDLLISTIAFQNEPY